jgi:outer membrane protein TolC
MSMIEGKNRARFAGVGALASLVLLTGCHVGPVYHAPAPPPVTAASYKESTVNFHDADGWKVASPQDAMLRGKWWEVFNEPELNALEEQLLIDNQSLKAYYQNYMEARAVIAEARAAYWPTVTVGPSFSRTRGSGNLAGASNNAGKTSSLWSLPVEASWTPDFWGKVKNEVRGAQYAAQVSAADLENEKLIEQSSLAEYFFEIRGQDNLQKILNQTVASDQKALDAAQGAFDSGTGDYISVVEAKATLESAQA